MLIRRNPASGALVNKDVPFLASRPHGLRSPVALRFKLIHFQVLHASIVLLRATLLVECHGLRGIEI